LSFLSRKKMKSRKQMPGSTPRLFPATWICDYRDLFAKLAEGADPNEQDAEGRTPLMVGCLYGVKECVEILVGAGCHLDTTDKLGRTALLFAVDSERQDLVELLLREGASPTVADAEGWNALICATVCNSPQMVSMLLQYGATRAARDARGKTALFWAVSRSTACVEALLYPSEINIADNNGRTPLMEAARQGKDSLYVKLLEHNANPDLADANGRTAKDWKELADARADNPHRSSSNREASSIRPETAGAQPTGNAPQSARRLGRQLSGPRRNTSTGLEECAICFQGMGRGARDMAAGLCGHIYCYDCLVAWVEEKGECPGCRSRLRAEQIIKLYAQ
jgi:hypothetical protein